MQTNNFFITKNEISFFFLFQNEAAKKKGSKTKEGKPKISKDYWLKCIVPKLEIERKTFEI